ncbi:MAG: hypothetical protein ACOYT8_04795 [Candidatus Dependentiae bacterium]
MKKLFLLGFIINLHAMEMPIERMHAYLEKVVNKTNHSIKIVNPNQQEFTIAPGKEIGGSEISKRFELPLSSPNAFLRTFIYLNDEQFYRLSLELMLNPSQNIRNQSFREFVAKLTMNYPKFFKNQSWQWSNKYITDFFEQGDYEWIFKISIIFKGENLQETELTFTRDVKQTR